MRFPPLFLSAPLPRPRRPRVAPRERRAGAAFHRLRSALPQALPSVTLDPMPHPSPTADAEPIPRPAAPGRGRADTAASDAGARPPARDLAALYGVAVVPAPPPARGGPEPSPEPCIVCGLAGAPAAMHLPEFGIWLRRCGGCGLGWLDPMPGKALLRSFYPEDYYGAPGHKFEALIEPVVRLVGARHARFLSRGLDPGARILDVGCGRGVHLRGLLDAGLEIHGFEISEEAVRGLDPRVRTRVAPDLREAGYPSAHFDEVILWHVLEHAADPLGLLDEIHRVLRPGGRLVVAVPNFGSLQARFAGPAWFHLDPPRHLFHFTVPALRRALLDRGFRVRSEHHFSLRQNPFGWVQSALNRIPGLPRNGLYVLLHRGAGPSEARWPRGLRLRLRAAFFALLPLGLGLSVIATWLRTGATIHLVAERDASAP